MSHVARAMTTIRIVLVEPKNEGNVGAIARAMKNFGAEKLVLVRPCPLGREARQRAMHGVDVLESAKTVRRLDTALRGADLVVGTSGVDTTSEKQFARIAITPRDFAARITPLDGTVALLLGREDFGLLDDELRRCDVLVTIPASETYPILNVSHAAAILLYELFASKAPRRSARETSGLEKEKLHGALSELLAASHYPEHKTARTRVMFRRMLGRAVPSKWEFHALMGVFQGATKRIRRLEGNR